METIKQFFTIIRAKFFALNREQRKAISSIFDKLAIGIMISIVFKLVTDNQEGDGFIIFLWSICAIILETLSIAALAAKDEEE